MREIKFRAWNKKDSAMIYTDMETLLDGYKASDFRVLYQEGELSHVMQFTGLKDKNGKDIYEGDIVKGFRIDYYRYNEEHIATVEYYDGSFYPFADSDDHAPYPKPNECEVIGNIYVNPELIK